MKKFLSVYLGLSLLLLFVTSAYPQDNLPGVKPGKPDRLNPAMPNKDQNQLVPVNEAQETVPWELEKAIRTGTVLEKFRAIDELGIYGSVAVPALINALKDKDFDVRRHAAEVLGEIGPEAKAAVSALIKALEDEDFMVRDAVAVALGKIGPEAKVVLPALINALKHEKFYVRRAAATTLGKIGREAKAAVPELIRALEDEDFYVRDAAATTLGKIGPEAKTGVPALIGLLKDKDPAPRASAVVSLGNIGTQPELVVPALTEALKDKDPHVRVLSAYALGDIGPDAKAAVPALTEALKDKDPHFCIGAAYALRKIGPEAKAIVATIAVPALVEVLKNQNASLQSSAAVALGEIGPEAKTAVPALTTLLKDGVALVRSSAAYALGDIGPEARTAVSALIKVLEDEDWHVRMDAANALGKIGPEAKPALLALIKALEDENFDVRDAALEALYKLNWHNDVSKIDDDFMTYALLQYANLFADSHESGTHRASLGTPRYEEYLQFTETLDKLFSNAILEMINDSAKWNNELFERIFVGKFGVTKGVDNNFPRTLSLLLLIKYQTNLPETARSRAKDLLSFFAKDERLLSHPRFTDGLKLALKDKAIPIEAKKEAVLLLARSSPGHKVLLDELRRSLALSSKGLFILNSLSQNASKNKEGMQREHTVFLLSLFAGLEEGNIAKDRIQEYISTLLKEKPGLGLDFDKDKELFKPILAFDFKKEMDKDIEFLLKVYLHEFKAEGAMKLVRACVYDLEVIDPSTEETNENAAATLKNLGKALAYSFPKDTSAKESFLEGFLITLHKNTSDTKLMDNAYYLLKEMSYYEQDTGGIFIKTIKELLVKNKKNLLFNDEVRDTLEYAVMEAGKRK